jgi:hypothetical protein
MWAIGVSYFSGSKRCHKNHHDFHGKIQLVKCCSPNIANLQSRATNFLKYVCSRISLPRKYRTLPVISIGSPIQLAGGWIDVATKNSAVAATPRGSQSDWRENTFSPRNICIPKYDQKLCIRPVYDKWFDDVVLILAAGPFKTYGRAQKFLNLFVKYVYSVERSDAIAPSLTHGFPGQPRVYHSRLESFVDFIRDQRQQRRTWQEIAVRLRDEKSCPITLQGLYQFYRRHLRRQARHHWESESAVAQPTPATTTTKPDKPDWFKNVE